MEGHFRDRMTIPETAEETTTSNLRAFRRLECRTMEQGFNLGIDVQRTMESHVRLSQSRDIGACAVRFSVSVDVSDFEHLTPRPTLEGY
jgi:hypothetical protein